MITTEAAGFRLLVRVLEEIEAGTWLQGTSLSAPYMCVLLDEQEWNHHPTLVERIDRLTRMDMIERIQEVVGHGGVWVFFSESDDSYTSRIIAAQWFALEAAEEGV